MGAGFSRRQQAGRARRRGRLQVGGDGRGGALGVARATRRYVPGHCGAGGRPDGHGGWLRRAGVKTRHGRGGRNGGWMVFVRYGMWAKMAGRGAIPVACARNRRFCRWLNIN
ncbi:hypothetical protein KCP75_10860 [Salmonella enterica subsp. enterica]|nr:hypothetical protein KCP75_10860 [Salmonella enterica subsp. enterica]